MKQYVWQHYTAGAHTRSQTEDRWETRSCKLCLGGSCVHPRNHLTSWQCVFLLAVSGLSALRLRLLSPSSPLSLQNETHHKCNGAVSFLSVRPSDRLLYSNISCSCFGFLLLAADVSDVRFWCCLLGQKLCCLKGWNHLLYFLWGDQKLNTCFLWKWKTVDPPMSLFQCCFPDKTGTSYFWHPVIDVYLGASCCHTFSASWLFYSQFLFFLIYSHCCFCVTSVLTLKVFWAVQ